MSEADLTDVQQEIFDKITHNKIDELKALLAANKIAANKVNFVDKDGMSPLQHACYKGNLEIAQLLLDHGADPNLCEHEPKYTALHFAAISENSDLCHLLLSRGAKITALNSVGRTAAQMAAFVGNHRSVAVINNFIPKADIDYYIEPRGLQSEPMLHPYLHDSFHTFIMQVNVHPVRVIMNLQKITGLLDNLEMIKKVLDSMCQREMTKGAETNEVMAFKFHYLGYIVNEVLKFLKSQEAESICKIDENGTNETNKKKFKEKKSETEILIKKLLISKSNGVHDYQEQLLRDAVRGFSYRNSAIFRQMVATLASTDPPSAISVIAAAINGQRAFNDSIQVCETCNEEVATKKCSKCKMVQYCDRECQRLHWFIHKKTCNQSTSS